MPAASILLPVVLAVLGPAAAAAPGDVSFNASMPPLLSPAGIARHLSVVDLDGDGRLDLVRSDVRVGIWRQLDDGRLTPALDLQQPGGAAAVADLDGDGLPSIVMVSSNGVRSMDMTAPWVFGPPTLLTAPDDGGSSSFAAAADLDDDGHVDILGESFPSGVLRFWHGDGAGGLLPSTQASSVPVDAVWMDLADLDLDGQLDLVAVESGSAISLLGQGDGSFLAQPPIALPGPGLGVALGNLDGDGLVDAAVATLAGVQLLKGTGDGSFVPGGVADAGTPTRSVDLYDSNGDGKDEILGTAGNLVRFLDSTSLEAVASFELTKDLGDAVFARLDGPAPVSVLATTRDSMWAELVVIDCDADGLPTAEKDLAPDTQALAIADLDGDGRSELVAWEPTAQQVVVRKIPGDGTLGPPSAGQPLEAAPVAHVVDLDGDANEDLLLVSFVKSSWSLLPWRSNGDGTFTPGVPVIPTVSGVFLVGLGDIDGDGDTDLLVLTGQSSVTATWYANQHDGSFGPATVASIPELNAPQQSFDTFALGDVDGDGLADMFLGSNSDGAGLREWKGLGGGIFAAPVVLASGLHGTQGVRVGDLDGDGHLDVFAHGFTTGDPILGFYNELTVLHGHGDGQFDAPRFFRTGTIFSTAPPWPVDFDGDGRLDLLVPSEGNGRIYLMPQAADGSFGAGRPLPIPMDVAQPDAPAADIDGDGVPDLLVDAAPYAFAPTPMRVAWVKLKDGALDLGHGKAGSSGLPVLVGGGALQPGQLAFFELQAAPPVAPLLLVLGLQTADIPIDSTSFLLPALVPEPQVVVGGLASDAIGNLALKARWPADAPPGLAVYAQIWCTDPFTGQSVASNALEFEGD